MMTMIFASRFTFCEASNSSRISGKFSLTSPGACQPDRAFVRYTETRRASSGVEPNSSSSK